jgi:hypothetical protein
VRAAVTTAAVLTAFDFDEQLERLRRALGDPLADAALLDPIVDALLVDLADELVALLAASGKSGVAEIDQALPRLQAAPRAMASVALGAVAGDAVVRLAARVRFVAECQAGWFARLPPWRWLGRATKTAARVRLHLEALLIAAFGDAQLEMARAAVDAAVLGLRRDHQRQRNIGTAGRRRQWALELGRAPLALPDVHADTELLANSQERVVAGEEYDAIFADEAANTLRRERLMEGAGQERARLSVVAPVR